MKSLRARTLLLWTLLFSSACATDSCSCAGFEQREFPANKLDKTIPAVGQARVTPTGLEFVNSQVPYLLEQVLPDGLSFCIPRDTSGNPDLCVESTCANGAPGCQVDLTLDDHSITPVPSDTVEIDILIGSVDERLNFDYGTFLGTVNCYVQLFKKGASESTPATVRGKAPLRIFVDQASPMREVGVELGEIGVNLDDVDFKIHGRGNVGDTIACEGASLVRSFFRGTIETQIRTALGDAVGSVRRAQLCRRCDTGCPNGSSCASDGICDYSDAQCVPRTLGMEGRLDLGSLIGDFLREDGAGLDAVAKAADLARVDTGVTVGLRGGFEPVGISDCVPVDPTARPPIAAVNLSPTVSGNTKPGGGPFMLGIGMHKSAFEQALWSAWASGGTCLEVSDRDVSVLSTTAFSLIVPSMKDLAGNGRAAVLAIVANDHPTVELGANTVSPSGTTYTIDDPLLRILWPNVDFHVFAYAQDRMTRMFTLRLDLDLPVALVADGNGSLVPVIPSLESAIARIEPRRLELLTEDSAKIADVVPTLLGLAGPQLAAAVPGAIEVPEFLGFRVALAQQDITSVDGGEFLAVFANLERAGSPVSLAADTAILSSHISYERVLPSGLVRPEVVLDVRPWSASLGSSSSQEHEYEYSWRVDGGFWSLFHRSNELHIDDPLFVIQGSHEIEVRARVVGEPATTDPVPARLSVRIDYQSPTLDARRTGDDVVFEGSDLADEELEYRVIDELGRSTGWTKQTRLPVAELGVQGKATVEARDDSGRTAQAQVTLPTSQEPTGCSTGAGALGLTPLLVFGIVALGRRRRRRLAFGAASAMVFLGAGCGGCKGELRTNADQRCFGSECDVDQACELDAECAGVCPEGNGGICEAGQCICVKACDPGCAEDAFCCLSTQECVSFTDLCTDEITCDPGYEPGVGSATPNRETCELEDIMCDCKPLPPIPIGWHGGHASIDSDGNITVVAAYNKTYGDLMVGQVNADGTIAWRTVDGAPSEGTPKGDPAGPRGGLTERAEHVGTHTAVVVDGGGRAHVFYRDEDNKVLKWGIATFGDAPSFESVTLDDGSDGGLWTSAAIAGDTIHVLHTVITETGASELRHLQLAAGGSPTAGASTVVLTEAAVEQGKGYPAHVGLFTDLTVTGTTPFAVFYNGVSERVGRMQFTAGAWTEPTYLASGTGPYAAGVLGADGLEHVAFMLSSGLRYSRFGDTATSLVNDGMRLFADEYWKGATGEDAAMRVEGAKLTVAFHDAFDRSLIVATSSDAVQWATETLAVEGAASGFYLAMTRRGEPWVADMVVDRRGESHAYLRVTKLD